MTTLPAISFDAVTCVRRGRGPLSAYGEEAIRHAEVRCRKFLALVAKYPERDLSPSKDIDEVWHAHMLNPRSYMRDCLTIFGDILDHDGGFGMDGSGQEEALAEIFRATSMLWFSEYDEPYVSHETHAMEKCIVSCKVKECRRACKKDR